MKDHIGKARKEGNRGSKEIFMERVGDGHESNGGPSPENGTTHIPSRNVAHVIHAALQDGAPLLQEQAHASVSIALQSADTCSQHETSQTVSLKESTSDTYKLSSLDVPLCQALQARDAVLLERLLSTASIPVIEKTVELLDPCSVQLLVKAILDTVESSPSRAEKVATWLSSIVKYHMAHMMTAPGMQKEILRLNQLVEERLRTYQGLQGLSGRLSLAIGG